MHGWIHRRNTPPATAEPDMQLPVCVPTRVVGRLHRRMGGGTPPRAGAHVAAATHSPADLVDIPPAKARMHAPPSPYPHRVYTCVAAASTRAGVEPFSVMGNHLATTTDHPLGGPYEYTAR
ncbi:hypothetical protein GQ55_2G163800 [Panicum hallii var. hallii]|uniref:Uncharacterized protein n=1 Tax=Panicum hallii var. hallii TaxID=1504633 RepID=A0A2T7EPX9_9POAL|nr:hypothetical protein GQ55_2G163800 [Panicum hallii var. hallii]